MKKICFLLFFATVALSAQIPQRKAFLGLVPKSNDLGVLVDSVMIHSTFSKLKLKKGDILVSINSNKVTLDNYVQAASPIRAKDKINVEYLRNGKLLSAKAPAIMKPYETSQFADVIYDWVKFQDGYLRAITRKPKYKEKNVPCILLIPGYGCGSIDFYSKSYNGKLIDAWLKNGYAVVTIEKSGMGDSYGCKPCSEVDLVTDIESFDTGYKYMEKLPFVDPSNLFIWGHSMGGTIAPEIAKLHHPKGVMVFGCVFRPWSEFLLEMHRVQKPLLEGLSYQQTEDFTRKIQKIYYEFFVLKKSLEQLVQIPEYKDLVISELGYKKDNNDMWGRHWKFWQQLDSLNLAKSWQETKCPVLVLHGGADYEQCSVVEPMLIQKTVNEKHPDFATWVTIQDLDHFMMKSNDWKQAAQHFKEQQYNKGNFNIKIAEETVKWLKNNS